MSTAVVIFLSKYFSTAKENRKREKADISIDGISVNNEKKAIYFLLALDPSTTISLFIEFLTSKKINRKNILNLRNYLTRNKINFVVLSGGEDIGKNKFRDFTEINLLKYSIQTNIPLLGLCRGMQLINLFFKGKLKKIEGHVKKKNKLYLKSEKKYRKVTCFHGNGIKKLGNGFFVMHKSYDNEVEI